MVMPLRKAKYSKIAVYIVFMQRWTSAKIVRLDWKKLWLYSNKRKIGLPCLVNLTFKWYEDAMVFCVFIFIFLLRTKGKTVRLNENDVRHCCRNFSKVPFWKLLDHRYVRSSFSKIMRHIDNNILKDTLPLKILRTWINVGVNCFIKTWEDIMKWKSKKLPEKL